VRPWFSFSVLRERYKHYNIFASSQLTFFRHGASGVKLYPGSRTRMIVAMVCLVCSDQLS
jgi:hypothetical protein